MNFESSQGWPYTNNQLIKLKIKFFTPPKRTLQNNDMRNATNTSKYYFQKKLIDSTHENTKCGMQFLERKCLINI